MNENSMLYGENKTLKERLRQIKSTTSTVTVDRSQQKTPPESRRNSGQVTLTTDQSVQVSATVVDSGSSPDHSHVELNPSRKVQTVEMSENVIAQQSKTMTTTTKENDHHCVLVDQVEQYQEKFCGLELQLDKVKHELHNLTEKHEASTLDWQQREFDWINQIAQKV